MKKVILPLVTVLFLCSQGAPVFDSSNYIQNLKNGLEAIKSGIAQGKELVEQYKQLEQMYLQLKELKEQGKLQSYIVEQLGFEKLPSLSSIQDLSTFNSYVDKLIKNVGVVKGYFSDEEKYFRKNSYSYYKKNPDKSALKDAFYKSQFGLGVEEVKKSFAKSGLLLKNIFQTFKQINNSDYEFNQKLHLLRSFEEKSAERLMRKIWEKEVSIQIQQNQGEDTKELENNLRSILEPLFKDYEEISELLFKKDQFSVEVKKMLNYKFIQAYLVRKKIIKYNVKSQQYYDAKKLGIPNIDKSIKKVRDEIKKIEEETEGKTIKETQERNLRELRIRERNLESEKEEILDNLSQELEELAEELPSLEDEYNEIVNQRMKYYKFYQNTKNNK